MKLPSLRRRVAPFLMLLPLLMAEVVVASGGIEFSPAGTVREVRQARARFSEPMVAFADPRVRAEIFDIDCGGAAGSARWLSEREWVFDFESNLPAGLRCTFTLKEGVKTLAGGTPSGDRVFSFSTGGPAIAWSTPWEGATIAEDQHLVLVLTGPVAPESIERSVWLEVEGRSERTEVDVVTGREAEATREAALGDEFKGVAVVLRPRLALPAESTVRLVWGAGVASPGGIATEANQLLTFGVRAPFSASVICERTNSKGSCVPVAQLRVRFTAPISVADAARIRLRLPDGTERTPEDPFTENFVQGVSFKAPFPPMIEARVVLPEGLADDAGRPLGESELPVQIGDYPPLVKFSAPFSVVERDDPVLPVSVRHVEDGGGAGRPVGGSGAVVRSVTAKDVPVILAWLTALNRADGHRSIFGAKEAGLKEQLLPVEAAGVPLQVVGIPLTGAGLHLVEVESHRLGSALFEQPVPMFVRSAALVTGLGDHFKWGREESLVFVTALTSGQPVPGAEVRIHDCTARQYFAGRTDDSGLVKVAGLPAESAIESCGGAPSALVITATTADDFTFTLSNWNRGIEPWRFELPTAWSDERRAAHTIFAQNLVRRGETVRMKHVLRERSGQGFGLPRAGTLPSLLRIAHVGSGEKQEIPLTWSSAGTAESSWEVPRSGRLGGWQTHLVWRKGEEEQEILSGSFRVEDYRVPLMRGALDAGAGSFIAPQKIPLTASVRYLAGGGAADLPVKVRYKVEPRTVTGPGEFSAFTVAAGYPTEERRQLTGYGDWEAPEAPQVETLDLKLDRTGTAAVTLGRIPEVTGAMQLQAELEYRDPAGESQTVTTSLPLWPAPVLLGIRSESWMSSGDLRFDVAAMTPQGEARGDLPVEVEVFEVKTLSHRKRLVGGFYGYENFQEITRTGTVCAGRTNERGLLRCEAKATIFGSLLLGVRSSETGVAPTKTQVWVSQGGQQWFGSGDDDRMDLVPERRTWNPGDRARIQVQMPFRAATALVTVEREGVLDAFVQELSGTEPVVEVPLKANYAPNVFVSVLALRGRIGDAAPTGTFDPGKPAFRLGLTELAVGTKAHELTVTVQPEREEFNVREKAKVRIQAVTAAGAPAAGASVAVAVVDEGVLELLENTSWDLLRAMMGRRPYDVITYTPQLQITGKRHFGLKARPQGGGGGTQLTRELFDTLLFWQSDLVLDRAGAAEVVVPLNDSITSFRIVAVALDGVDRFGRGESVIRSRRDLVVLPGLPPLVTAGDRVEASITVRNTTGSPMDLLVTCAVVGAEGGGERAVTVPAGQAEVVSWPVTIPAGVEHLEYTLEAREGARIHDRVSVQQQVRPAVREEVQQAVWHHLDNHLSIPVAAPAGALPGVGGVRLSLSRSIGGGLPGVTEYMRAYPYTCLEQRVSRAIALGDDRAWQGVMSDLPAYLDGRGLARYFPTMTNGSEVLTAYLLSVSAAAGREIPVETRARLRAGLEAWVSGEQSDTAVVDTAARRIEMLAALEALARSGGVDPVRVEGVVPDVGLLPDIALIEWYSLLLRTPKVSDRTVLLGAAERELRARLTAQGTSLDLAADERDQQWWRMVSGDVGSLRLLELLLDQQQWREDLPRLARGALLRQQEGRWDLTTANAWGRIAFDRFGRMFEAAPVAGVTKLDLGAETVEAGWQGSVVPAPVLLPFPVGSAPLMADHEGSGAPWLLIESRAAVPLTAPLASGYRVERAIEPVLQRTPGVWSVGDIINVRLALNATSDRTWMVVNDPIPAGATILGGGLKRDTMAAAPKPGDESWFWPVYEERSFDSYRAYYDFVPRGEYVVNYRLRLNAAGTFILPGTRVEAMYSPEMFGALPNSSLTVVP